jgi:hypothetical protein
LSSWFSLSRHGFHANNQLDGGNGGGRMECINTPNGVPEMTYSLSIRQVGGYNVFTPSRAVRSIPTILENGVYFADVPAGSDGQKIIDQMNRIASQQIAFATEAEDFAYANENNAG